jgi:hypothetical protein
MCRSGDVREQWYRADIVVRSATDDVIVFERDRPSPVPLELTQARVNFAKDDDVGFAVHSPIREQPPDDHASWHCSGDPDEWKPAMSQ